MVPITAKILATKPRSHQVSQRKNKSNVLIYNVVIEILEMYSKEKILECLKLASWDFNVHEKELLRLLNGEIDSIGWVKRNNLYAEILKCFSWDEVREIIPQEKLPEALSIEVIQILFPRSLRDKYLPIRESVIGSGDLLNKY